MSGEYSALPNREIDDMEALIVQAHWDAEARVWWTDGDDVPGLATEAPTFPELVDHVKSLAPVLIQENMGRTTAGTRICVKGANQEKAFLL